MMNSVKQVARIEPLSVSQPALPALHVLLVDDDEFMGEWMSEMLVELGIESIQVASNGQRALDIFASADPKPNLLFCDLCMPGMDGFQFLSKLASKNYAGDVVIISSYNKEGPVSGEWALANYKASTLHLAEKLARVQGLKVRATLEKPFSREQLFDLISLINIQRAR